MDGVAAALPCNGDELLDVEVGGRPRPFEGDGLVRLAGVQRAGIIPGGNRHRGDVQFGRCPDDPDGDFASVRHKQFHLESGSFRFN